MKDVYTILEILQMERTQLITEICSEADYKGIESWLWEPKEECASRVCMVAHIDTVWDKSRARPRIFYDSAHEVYWSPDGLGADDRAGVWAGLEVRQQTGCGLLLCDFEESGGKGAFEAVEMLKPELEKFDCFVEVDRRGKQQAVFYFDVPKAFRRWVKSFGFEQHTGTFSDISIIGPGVRRPAVNLSAGYEYEHRTSEFLTWPDLRFTCAAAVAMVKSGAGHEFIAAQQNIFRAAEARERRWLQRQANLAEVKDAPDLEVPTEDADFDLEALAQWYTKEFGKDPEMELMLEREKADPKNYKNSAEAPIVTAKLSQGAPTRLQRVSPTRFPREVKLPR